MFQGSGFKRTLCGESWKVIIGKKTDTARYGCCGAGHYMSSPEVPFSDGASCQSCPSGYHGSPDENDETSCQVCPAETFNVVQGAIECCGCEQGEYIRTNYSNQNDVSTTCPSCNICPLGTYTDVRNFYKCKSCPEGYYTNDEKNSEGNATRNRCEGCPSGTYGEQEKQKTKEECINCMIGTYNDVAGLAEKVVCKSCPLGFVQNEKGKAHCLECQPGKFGTKKNENNKITNICEDCKKNTFSFRTKMSSCMNCSIGRTSRKGQKQCTDCKAGQHKDNGGCAPCTAGMFQPDKEKDKCKSCDIGKSSLEGAGACTDCRIGRYGQQTITKEIRTCDSCPFNTYQDEEGQKSFKRCKDGLVTNKQDHGKI